jgi:hypothetical protein
MKPSKMKIGIGNKKLIYTIFNNSNIYRFLPKFKKTNVQKKKKKI